MDEKKKYLTLRQFIAFSIAIIGTSITIFACGFMLGDKWSGIKRTELIETVENQDTKIKKMANQILILQKSKPEVQIILEQIQKEDILFFGQSTNNTKQISHDYLNINYADTYTFNNSIYISFNGIKPENNNDAFVNNNLNYQKVLLNVGFGTYKSKTKYYDLHIGDTFRFVLDGQVYIVLLNHLSQSYLDSDKEKKRPLYELYIKIFETK